MRPVTILLAAPLLLAVTGTPPAFAQESGGKAGVEDAGPTAGGSARAEPADLLALSGDELIETVNGAEFTGPLKPLAPEDKAPGEDASAEVRTTPRRTSATAPIPSSSSCRCCSTGPMRARA